MIHLFKNITVFRDSKKLLSETSSKSLLMLVLGLHCRFNASAVTNDNFFLWLLLYLDDLHQQYFVYDEHLTIIMHIIIHLNTLAKTKFLRRKIMVIIMDLFTSVKSRIQVSKEDTFRK